MLIGQWEALSCFARSSTEEERSSSRAAPEISVCITMALGWWFPSHCISPPCCLLLGPHYCLSSEPAILLLVSEPQRIPRVTLRSPSVASISFDYLMVVPECLYFFVAISSRRASEEAVMKEKLDPQCNTAAVLQLHVYISVQTGTVCSHAESYSAVCLQVWTNWEDCWCTWMNNFAAFGETNMLKIPDFWIPSLPLLQIKYCFCSRWQPQCVSVCQSAFCTFQQLAVRRGDKGLLRAVTLQHTDR